MKCDNDLKATILRNKYNGMQPAIKARSKTKLAAKKTKGGA